jgi:hypothetical protein
MVIQLPNFLMLRSDFVDLQLKLSDFTRLKTIFVRKEVVYNVRL